MALSHGLRRQTAAAASSPRQRETIKGWSTRRVRDRLPADAEEKGESAELWCALAPADV
jgi:hypothetical protein